LKIEIKISRAPESNDPETVLEFSRKIQDLINYIEVLPNNQYHLTDPGLAKECAKRLCPEMKKDWFTYIESRKRKVTLKRFGKWLDQQSKIFREVIRGSTTFDKPRNRVANINFHVGDGDAIKKNNFCLYCSVIGHGIIKCEPFKSMRISQKFSFLKRKNCCFVC
jgi:hypothetical protein